MDCSCFFLSHRLPFTLFITAAFAEMKLFHLMQSHFSVFAFVACAFGVISMKSLPNTLVMEFYPLLSYKSFVIQGLHLNL
jgi:hypothetical protein